MKWLVLYTRPNLELKIAKEINELGIESYCPSYKQMKQYSDRKKQVVKPLLPSYVLVYINEKDRNLVFNVPGVLRYLFWLGKPAEVRTEEVDLLKQNISGVYSRVYIESLKKGENYTISSGPLKGHEGKVLNMSNNKLRLKLPNLGVLVTLQTVAA